jgi:cell wall-associated NlpC family hydrolase
MRLGHSRSTWMAQAGTAALMLALLAVVGVGVTSQSEAAAPAKSSPSLTAGSKTEPAAASTTTSMASSAVGNAILWYAAVEKGKPYCYGGGGIHGPSAEINNSSNPGCAPPKKGFDCMSLAQYAVYQGTGGKVALPNNSSQLKGVGTFIPPSGTNDLGGLQRGDVVYWGSNINAYSHSGVYAGNGEVWDAYDNNVPVGEHTFSFLLKSYTYLGAYQYFTDSAPSFSITTTSLPSGTVYSQTQKSYRTVLHTANGTAPYAWSLASGSKALPPGLKLGASTGVISGNATRAGTYSFQIQVVDTKSTSSPSKTAKRSLSIRIT